MQNIASICSVTQGLLWLLVRTQVKAEKRRDSLIKNKTQCTQTYEQVAGNINCCWAAFVPQGSTIPQMPQSSPVSPKSPWPSYSTHHSWAFSQVTHAVFIWRAHSWPGLNTDLMIQIVLKVWSSSWETRISLHWWRGWKSQAEAVHTQCCQAAAGNAAAFHGSSVPQEPSPLQERRRYESSWLLHCCYIILYHPFSFTGPIWQGWTAMKMCLLPSLALANIYSIRQDVLQLRVNETSKSRAVWLLIKQLLIHQISLPCKFFSVWVSFPTCMESIYPSRKVLLRTNVCMQYILFELSFG